MTWAALAALCEKAAHSKTLYVHGAFGWPMTESNKRKALARYPYNRRTDRAALIDKAAADTFGFDCICFVKAMLWGWEGDITKEYGGVKYQSNGIPDVTEDALLDMCADVSSDFSTIQPGEYLYSTGHCGIYYGDGWAVECTHRWDDGVQFTRVKNLYPDDLSNGRVWQKHGKLPGIVYEAPGAAESGEKSGKDFTLAFKNLRAGDSGEAVEAMQALLITRGYSCGPDGADGVFGANTEKAVMQYQGDCEIAVDGIAGVQTMSRLLGII